MHETGKYKWDEPPGWLTSRFRAFIGGSSDTYGYVHLGVPVEDMNYFFHELGKLVTQFEDDL